MWVLGKPGAFGIKAASNGHGDVTAVSAGPPPSMPRGIPHPGCAVVVWCALPHRSSFGALPSLLCSPVTKKRTKIHKAGVFSWVADLATPEGDGMSRGTAVIFISYLRHFPFLPFISFFSFLWLHFFGSISFAGSIYQAT